jgi:hypothetical protein
MISLQDRATEYFAFFIEKPVLEKFQVAVRSVTGLEDREHMFFIK